MKRDSQTAIAALASQLSGLRRRAARQKRNIKSRPEEWREWSATMDEIAGLTQRLVASPTPDLASLAAKFRAILWLIDVNESLLDSGDLRRLRRFDRDLSVLASGRS